MSSFLQSHGFILWVRVHIGVNNDEEIGTLHDVRTWLDRFAGLPGEKKVVNFKMLLKGTVTN